MENHIYTPTLFTQKIAMLENWEASRLMFRQRQNILLVQNDPELRSILKSLLAGAKFHLVSSDSGQDAIGILNNGGIDLIVSDLKLPDMSGLKLVKKVRSCSKNSYLKNIPIILLTSQSKDLELLAISMGVDMLCQKRQVKKALVPQIRLLLE